LVRDLFTEIRHDPQVIPDTESVAVRISARATAEMSVNIAKMPALINFFKRFSSG